MRQTVLSIFAVILAFSIQSEASAQSDSPTLTANASFHCLWWSEAEMENLDPNSPPPKRTDVIIKKWEYSDPVGIPHPDVVDLVMEIGNKGQSQSPQLVADISGQWRIGPIASQRKAAWGPSTLLKTWNLEGLLPGQTASVRVAIDLAGRMSELRTKNAWPWQFRASLTVRDAHSGKTLLSREFPLPIQPGD
jgi:hypothetical protein